MKRTVFDRPKPWQPLPVSTALNEGPPLPYAVGPAHQCSSKCWFGSFREERYNTPAILRSNGIFYLDPVVWLERADREVPEAGYHIHQDVGLSAREPSAVCTIGDQLPCC